jgi:hypothetical protein
MLEATAAGEFDAVLHSGDCEFETSHAAVPSFLLPSPPHPCPAVAYDLEDDGGANGNTYMNMVQPIASRLSYTVGPGNHEADGDGTFTQYQSRWAGVAATAGQSSGSGTVLYYSYDDGLTHFVVIDTEQYYYDPDGVAAQYAWLEADLAKVDRAVTPWLIVLGHKGYWMKVCE